MHHQLRSAFFRLVGPYRINRIALDGDQFGALGLERAAGAFDPALGMHPWVIADACACRCMIFQPVGDAGLRHSDILPILSVDLFAHLQRVSSVGEDGRFFAQHNRRPGRTAKARQPSQPLGIVADIFGHMFIADRDNKAVELVFLQLRAQGA